MTQYNNYCFAGSHQLGRMNQYNVGKIFACLRVRKQLVALPTQRTAGDAGEEYNVDRGNQTDVLAKEKILHHFLDQKDLR